jgi:DNA-binding MarR family transcriptional regulator
MGKAKAAETGRKWVPKPILKILPEREPAADVGEINEILGFHIRLAHGAAYRHFMETFTELDLTQKQVSVMWLVSDNPGMAQTDLAQRLRMDRATTMGIVNRLQERAFLERGRSSEDRRRQTLYLTEAGEAMLVRARAAVREHEAWLKARFTPAEVATLMELLERIHE